MVWLNCMPLYAWLWAVSATTKLFPWSSASNIDSFTSQQLYLSVHNSLLHYLPLIPSLTPTLSLSLFPLIPPILSHSPHLSLIPSLPYSSLWLQPLSLFLSRFLLPHLPFYLSRPLNNDCMKEAWYNIHKNNNIIILLAKLHCNFLINV